MVWEILQSARDAQGLTRKALAEAMSVRWPPYGRRLLPARSFWGNGPFLVDRENERLIRTATSRPVRQQVADHERRLRREAQAQHMAAKRFNRGEGG
ncbi:hypothetical protein [Streptomyces peucetius]